MKPTIIQILNHRFTVIGATRRHLPLSTPITEFRVFVIGAARRHLPLSTPITDSVALQFPRPCLDHYLQSHRMSCRQQAMCLKQLVKTRSQNSQHDFLKGHGTRRKSVSSHLCAQRVTAASASHPPSLPIPAKMQISLMASLYQTSVLRARH